MPFKFESNLTIDIFTHTAQTKNNNKIQFKLFNKFCDYNDELTNTVNSINGFISSESFYKSDIDNIHIHNDLILTLSEWKSYRDWNDWFNSNIRYNIKKKYIESIENEQIFILKKNNLFLL